MKMSTHVAPVYIAIHPLAAASAVRFSKNASVIIQVAAVDIQITPCLMKDSLGN